MSNVSMEITKVESLPKFKDTRLNAAAKIIRDALNDSYNAVSGAVDKHEANKATIAKALAMVKRDKAYEMDGFKSIADFAEQTFNINRSNAYQLAQTAERFLLPAEDESNAESCAIATAHPTFTPSKLATLVNVPDSAITEGLESGAISPDSTQAELKEFAKLHKETKTADSKTIPVYDWVAYFGHSTMQSNEPCFKQDIVATACAACGIDSEPCDIINAHAYTTEDGKKVSRLVVLIPIADRFVSVLVDYTERKPAKSAKPKNAKTVKYTKAQLLAMLAEAEDDEDGQ